MLQQTCAAYTKMAFLCQPQNALAACLLVAGGWLADALAIAVASFVVSAAAGQGVVSMMSGQHLSSAACLQGYGAISGHISE